MKSLLERLWDKHRERWTRDYPWLGAQVVHEQGKRRFGLGCYMCCQADTNRKANRIISLETCMIN